MANDDRKTALALRDALDPIDAIDDAMVDIQANFDKLAGALEAGDRARIELAANELIDAWLVVDAAVQLLDAPTVAAGEQLRIARCALWVAGQIVDELFACALTGADAGMADFLRRVRATAAFVLGHNHDEPPVEDRDLC
jgi:hypothetical protein